MLNNWVSILIAIYLGKNTLKLKTPGIGTGKGTGILQSF